jgi:two-component system NtrC family sensor kinase
MRVLIAEDESLSRRLLESYLRQWGHEVTAAADGAEAWRLFVAGEFPLVLTDWVMPEVDGLELIRRIRERPEPRYVYIILLTAKAQKEDVIQGLDAGADDYVSKPFDRGELRVRLQAGERIIRLEHTLAEQNRQLRETQAALVQSEKLASLGQLAAGVAHEINNPLAYVLNNVAVLRRDVTAAVEVLDRYRAGRESLARLEPDLAAEAARLEEAIDLAYVQAHLPRMFEKTLEGLGRVRDIVKNLRDFARLDEADFKEADLNAAIESTLEILRHEIRQKSLVIQKHFGDVPAVACHPGKINQVFLNILVNAVHACSPGGTIEVWTHREGEAGAAPLQPVVAAQGSSADGVVVEVKDTGSGIKPEHLQHLFEPFFTTKPVGQGTGLGLSVSYGIVRDHGGAIEVESEVGKGSLFRIRLPLRPPGGDGRR